MERETIVEALAIVTAIAVYFGLDFIVKKSVNQRINKGCTMIKRNASEVKQRIEWVAKAPQRICSNCLYMRRYGAFDEKFECKKHVFPTKGNAVCKDYVPKKELE